MLSFDQYFDDHVIACTSEREANFSFASMENPYNRSHSQFVAEHFDFSLDDVFSLRQVHGNEIIVIPKEYEKVSNYPEADGIITNKVQLPIAIRTADCVPVFIFDREKNCSGLIHAGWRSTEQKILEKAVGLFQSEFGSKSENLKVVLGPSIRDCCYEVAEEFVQYFPEDVTREEKIYLNLPQANVRRLIRQGIKQEHIFDSKVCTCCNKNFFSYRREGADTGRMISFMMIKGEKNAHCCSHHRKNS